MRIKPVSKKRANSKATQKKSSGNDKVQSEAISPSLNKDTEYVPDLNEESEDENSSKPKRLRRTPSPLPNFQTNIEETEAASTVNVAPIATSQVNSASQVAPIMQPVMMQNMMQTMMSQMMPQMMMQPMMIQHMMPQTSQNTPELKKNETRGRKPGSKATKASVEERTVEVCSIKWNCDSNHPNFALNNKIDTSPLEKIFGFGTTVFKTDVRLTKSLICAFYYFNYFLPML